MFGGSADEWRRCTTIRSCKTIDDLSDELDSLGFHLSRSGLYLRLQPRSFGTTERKRHVITVPVILFRSRNNARKMHQNGKFCATSIMSVQQIISALGLKLVIVVSQDDKSKIYLGLAAAKLQAPILMHMEYKLTLPDHGSVVASHHKLIPSVYAVLTIADDRIGDLKSVGYSEPTHIAIRSAKHRSSTAATHAFDFERLVEIDDFRDFFFFIWTLAQVWSDISIDDYPVVAVHAGETSVADEPEEVDMDWYDVHVRESQYLLQVVKCNDRDCCGDLGCSLKYILPQSDDVLPPPFLLRRSKDGILEIPTREDTNSNDSFCDLFLKQSIGLRPFTTTASPVSYDYYCPSVRNRITGHLCQLCGAYFGSKKRKELHSKYKHGSESNGKFELNAFRQSVGMSCSAKLALRNH
ncbi:hypothetical protein QAD02_016273 [Eretmocerus hayati]|uniref:Uncharacterized protein n=1 Tax=Eretmocerus hayati TaxID=131215 RepID=A0ACC2PCF6_9HYME|nr:hypothetical protein QAD02_016273 [Eretmocerus hayati]